MDTLNVLNLIEGVYNPFNTVQYSLKLEKPLDSADVCPSSSFSQKLTHYSKGEMSWP